MTTYSRYPSGAYVYAYLRHSDSAIAKSGTPYYIGKGTGNRAWVNHHRIPVPNNKENIIILKDGLDDYDACDLEIRMIRWYGRVDLGTGILRNLTDGGMRIAPEMREKFSKISSKRIHSAETKLKIGNALRGKKTGPRPAWAIENAVKGKARNKHKHKKRIYVCSEETKNKLKCRSWYNDGNNNYFLKKDDIQIEQRALLKGMVPKNRHPS